MRMKVVEKRGASKSSESDDEGIAKRYSDLRRCNCKLTKQDQSSHTVCFHLIAPLRYVILENGERVGWRKHRTP